MLLHKIQDFDPNYRAHFEEQDVIGDDSYTSLDKIGSVDDLLVDDVGKIRYLVINTGVWIMGKKVLLMTATPTPTSVIHNCTTWTIATTRTCGCTRSGWLLEELDIDAEGRTIEDRTGRSLKDLV